MHRLACLNLLLLLAPLAVAQTQGELAARFGAPETERYAVAPGAILTVTYGAERQACRIVLEPRPAAKAGPNSEARYLPSSLVDSLLEELAPSWDRKGKPVGFAQMMSCHTAVSEEYENVRISRATNQCIPPPSDKDSSLVIEWKRPDCPAGR